MSINVCINSNQKGGCTLMLFSILETSFFNICLYVRRLYVALEAVSKALEPQNRPDCITFA